MLTSMSYKSTKHFDSVAMPSFTCAKVAGPGILGR